ncbi:MAG: ribulokinase, partial [Planctomycetia bacterium]|nr:ribulokinase [Planctomycetia bacterium]
MNKKRFALGIDYGTASVRAVIVDIDCGSEAAAAAVPYPSGTDGVLVDAENPLIARQNPKDYHRCLAEAIHQAISEARKNGLSPDLIGGIGVDTTGSTPIPVDDQGIPLGFHPEYEQDLDAMAWLWKDHTSFAEAEEITDLAKKLGRPFLVKCGGVYSSEWFWSKILHCVRTNPRLSNQIASWIELADYIPGWLTGNRKPVTAVRGICAAGHKCLYSAAWGGWPDEDFLNRLDPCLVRFRKTLQTPQTSDQKAGFLCEDAAELLGLPRGIPVAAGGFDAHFGAVGCGIVPGCLVKIIGTSTCDIMVHPLQNDLADIPGLCGIVPGSVLPNMYGLEAGQSAVGDLFNWFVHLFDSQDSLCGISHDFLTQEAASLRPGQSGLAALDWNNGNRTILTDPRLSGLIIGATLQTRPAELYRSLI